MICECGKNMRQINETLHLCQYCGKEYVQLQMLLDKPKKERERKHRPEKTTPLAQIMKQRGVSGAALSRQIGVSEPSVTEAIRGKASDKLLARIAVALGVSARELKHE